jgi:hypothetical protein
MKVIGYVREAGNFEDIQESVSLQKSEIEDFCQENELELLETIVSDKVAPYLDCPHLDDALDKDADALVIAWPSVITDNILGANDFDDRLRTRNRALFIVSEKGVIDFSKANSPNYKNAWMGEPVMRGGPTAPAKS